VPIGLYAMIVGTPHRGQIAVIRLPHGAAVLAAARGYLAPGALLIKPVAAGPGDIVCRHGPTVTINGGTVGSARSADAAGRPLPRWNGCITLAAHQVFVLAPVPDSFDGRYFGPLDRTHVLGTAHPLWMSPMPVHAAVQPPARAPARHQTAPIAA
jgi:conjugative transfer signal peptidase TraF